MSDREPIWHKSGDITFPWREEMFEIYLPTIGEMRQIEEYQVQLADQMGMTAKQERLREITDEIAAAKEADDEEKVAEILRQVTDEMEEVSNQVIELAKEQSAKWFQKVVELCGSGNWPADPDDWPFPVRMAGIVSKVKAHWGSAPLAWGAPTQNGAQNPTTVINNQN